MEEDNLQSISSLQFDLLFLKKEMQSMFEEAENMENLVNSVSVVLQEVKYKDVHDRLLELENTNIYELVPLDKLKIPFDVNDHREKLKQTSNQFHAIYTCSLGSVLKSEGNFKRYYLKENIIASEVILFNGCVVIELGGRPFYVKDMNFYDTLLEVFKLFKEKAVKV